ncbi:ParB/RepB/Spo0J family partition protein [Brevundimonas sp.]|uniref:ParB/RepB/Spo0J family partition protein n=1 Tax=Brevundimonas sp. TaxID=1871086 RepID=UPI003D6D93AC
MSDALPVARTIYVVDIDQIDPRGGLRPLNQAWVEALAALMKRDGQDEPIEIYRTKGGGFGMTAGRHRLAAATLLGWKQIDADIQDRNALDRQAREIGENLFRQELSPLDRAAFVAKQIEIERARAGVSEDATPQSVAAQARWSDRLKADAQDASANLAHAYRFTEQVAETLGLSKRSIYLDLELHRGLNPDVATTIRATAVAGNASQLRALARMSDADQRLVAGLIAEGTAKGVTDAAATLKQAPVKSPVQKAWSAIVSNWSRLGSRDRKDVLRQLAQGELPKGVVITIDGETFGGTQ